MSGRRRALATGAAVLVAGAAVLLAGAAVLVAGAAVPQLDHALIVASDLRPKHPLW